MRWALFFPGLLTLGCVTPTETGDPRSVVTTLYVDVERSGVSDLWDRQAPLLSAAFKARVLERNRVCADAQRVLNDSPDATSDDLPAACESSPITCVNGLLATAVVGDVTGEDGAASVVVSQDQVSLKVHVVREHGAWKVDGVDCGFASDGEEHR